MKQERHIKQLRRLTPEERLGILRDFRETDMRVTAIAAKWHTSTQTVYSVLHSFGVPKER